MALGRQQLAEEEAVEVEGVGQTLWTLAGVEVVVKTQDPVEEEAGTGPYPRNIEAVVVEGSLAETLRSHPWVEVGVVEGGCPLQVEVEGSWLEDAAAVGKVLSNSWQPQEVVEEGTLGLEVVAEESQLMVGVEVEVTHPSPE